MDHTKVRVPCRCLTQYLRYCSIWILNTILKYGFCSLDTWNSNAVPFVVAVLFTKDTFTENLGLCISNNTCRTRWRHACLLILLQKMTIFDFCSKLLFILYLWLFFWSWLHFLFFCNNRIFWKVWRHSFDHKLYVFRKPVKTVMRSHKGWPKPP